ncbi:MAG: DUF4175 family protein [Ignavibacteria bacterium]
MMNTQQFYKEIIKKFDRMTRREYASLSLSGIQMALIFILPMALCFALLELAGDLSAGVRTGMFFVFLIISFALLLCLFIYPALKYSRLFNPKDHNATARKVGRMFPAVKDELLNAIQLVSLNDGRTVYSESLVDAAFGQVYYKTQSVEFADAVSFAKPKQLVAYSLAVIIIVASFFVFLPGLSSAGMRIINFNRGFIQPAKFIIKVTPGDMEITRGGDVLIKATIYGAKPHEVNLFVKYAEQAEFEIKTLTADSTGDYSFEIPATRSSFKYYVIAEDVKSHDYSVTVVDKPLIRSLNLTVIQPGYSKLPPIEQKDNGNVTALSGSQMNFKIFSTRPLKKAQIVFADSSLADLKVDDRTAAGICKVSKDVDYKIIIRDIDGRGNDNPVNYSIKVLMDQPPVIEFVSPNKNVTLGEEDRLPVLLKISDDYGFNKLLLHYRLSGSKRAKLQENFSNIELPLNKSLKEEDINYIWNLSPLKLSAEEVVTYYLEVFDNDIINGPKSAKTASFTVRVPSLDELFKQADIVQQHSENKLAETLTEAQKLKENLEKLSHDLKQDKKDISWQEKEKVEKSMQKFEELSQKADDIRKDMAKVQNDMQQNNLLSKETLQKYMEIQELFKQLGSEEMKKMMEKMQTALQQMNRENIQQNLEQMKFDEEQFKKSLDRTLQLLKRAQIEQKMDETIKRAQDLADKIENLKNETGKSNLNDKNQKQNLKSEQKDVTEDLKELAGKMEELGKRMSEFDDMPKEQMQKTVEEFEKQQNEKMSEQAENQIEQGQKQQAQQSQQNLEQNIKKNKQSMSSMQSQMRQQNQMQAFNDMRKILDNLLTLSREQEKLKTRTQNMEQNSSSLGESARKQSGLQGNMEKILSQLNKVSQKTFAISPEMGKALGKAGSNMRQSAGELQARNSSGAQIKQTEAMGALNEAASILKNSMESMMNGGGEGGMASLMQQLQKLSGQQMSLNNMTQMMNKGSMSMEQQSGMQRLAQQQEMIRKSLEQLNKESKAAGQSKKFPANLDNIAKEMQEVVSGMRTEKMNDNLIQKQEKILSKLLDAQRSINDRDFEKERESDSGQNIAGKSPAGLNLPASKRNNVKDELIRAVREGYSKDYENLIRKYYEALEKSG